MERSENKPAAELTPSPTLARRPRPGERWRLHDDLARLERRSVSGALVLVRWWHDAEDPRCSWAIVDVEGRRRPKDVTVLAADFRCPVNC